jgi:hypothetical protein
MGSFSDNHRLSAPGFDEQTSLLQYAGLTPLRAIVAAKTG